VKSGIQIPSLDGLRAVAFTFVFLAHAGLSHVVPGAFGVTVFFFLSGFLITTLMRLEYETSKRISFKHFYLRRVLRIFPPFYLVLAGAVVGCLIGVVPGMFEWRAVIAQALHYGNYWLIVHGFDGVPAGTGVYWSLAVEEHFYLLFPLLYRLLTRFVLTPRGQATMLWALCGLVLLWRFVLVVGLGSGEDRTAIATDTRVDSLLFGCALAIFGNPALDSSSFGERTWKGVLLPLAVVGLLATFLVRDMTFRETVRYSLQGVCLIPVFVCAIRYPSWGPMRVLNLRPVAYVGMLSYSLYLMHQILIYVAIEQLQGKVHRFFVGVVALGAALLLASIIYQLVEKPCARLRKRLHAP
jgi:peptidoglycan/LPS O-acetylase OafA/YrhL